MLHLGEDVATLLLVILFNQNFKLCKLFSLCRVDCVDELGHFHQLVIYSREHVHIVLQKWQILQSILQEFDSRTDWHWLKLLEDQVCAEVLAWHGCVAIDALEVAWHIRLIANSVVAAPCLAVE